MSFRTYLSTLASWAALAATPLAAQSHGPVYRVYVSNESSDLVSLVRFGPDGLTEEKSVGVGFLPMDNDGAHGVTVSPDGQHWYVSLAHGNPWGRVARYATGSDEPDGSTEVGLFPASMTTSADGALLFVSNLDLHGDPVPGTVSVVLTGPMEEITKITTCMHPHGGRLSPDGRFHYSTCMHGDQLVEISTDRLAVSRRLQLTAGMEGIVTIDDTGAGHASHGGACRPTWVAVAPVQPRLYVACNARGEVLEIDATNLALLRRFPTGRGPYNAEVAPDGRTLAVTLKGAGGVTLIDLASGESTTLPTLRGVTHGVAFSPDSRYAFVTSEGIGSTPGSIDVVDVSARRIAASTELHLQPGGVAFWRMDD